MKLFCHTGHQSVEYKLFTDYYHDLVNILPADNLSHYFVTDKIISLEDYEKIIRCSLPQEAANILLDKMLLHLQNGNSAMFNKMLLIMDDHGGIDAKELSHEIRSKLPAVKWKDNVASKNGQNISHLYLANSFTLKIKILTKECGSIAANKV